MRGLGRALDRYILGAFLRIFFATAIGFPVLVIVIDLTENIDKFMGREIPMAQVALSYVYFIPESLFMVLPASVLFATVFTIGSLTRHSEITAAKASGISFYRLIVPLAFGASLATGIGLVVGELVPVSNSKREEILGDKSARGLDSRFSFTYAAEDGRVYTVGRIDQQRASISELQIERRGTGPDYPTVVAIASNGDWRADRGWEFRNGVVHVLPADTSVLSVAFTTMIDRQMTERPMDLLQNPKAPEQMRRDDLGRFISAMQRSGVDVNPLRVDRMLRIAIPVTCLIIFLFGAPLATSDKRGGAAFGIGIALATTVIFLMLVQLTKAVGGKGILTPELAAWIPSMVFGAAGLVLLFRLRT